MFAKTSTNCELQGSKYALEVPTLDIAEVWESNGFPTVDFKMTPSSQMESHFLIFSILLTSHFLLPEQQVKQIDCIKLQGSGHQTHVERLLHLICISQISAASQLPNKYILIHPLLP